MKKHYYEIITTPNGDKKFIAGPILGNCYETKDGKLVQVLETKAVAILERGEWAELQPTEEITI